MKKMTARYPRVMDTMAMGAAGATFGTVMVWLYNLSLVQ